MSREKGSLNLIYSRTSNTYLTYTHQKYHTCGCFSRLPFVYVSVCRPQILEKKIGRQGVSGTEDRKMIYVVHKRKQSKCEAICHPCRNRRGSSADAAERVQTLSRTVTGTSEFPHRRGPSTNRRWPEERRVFRVFLSRVHLVTWFPGFQYTRRCAVLVGSGSTCRQQMISEKKMLIGRVLLIDFPADLQQKFTEDQPKMATFVLLRFLSERPEAQ